MYFFHKISVFYNKNNWRYLLNYINTILKDLDLLDRINLFLSIEQGENVRLLLETDIELASLICDKLANFITKNQSLEYHSENSDFILKKYQNNSILVDGFKLNNKSPYSDKELFYIRNILSKLLLTTRYFDENFLIKIHCSILFIVYKDIFIKDEISSLSLNHL